MMLVSRLPHARNSFTIDYGHADCSKDIGAIQILGSGRPDAASAKDFARYPLHVSTLQIKRMAQLGEDCLNLLTPRSVSSGLACGVKEARAVVGQHQPSHRSFDDIFHPCNVRLVAPVALFNGGGKITIGFTFHFCARKGNGSDCATGAPRSIYRKAVPQRR